VNITQSFDEQRLVAWEIPADLADAITYEPGAPIWIPYSRHVNAVAPETMTRAPVKQVVDLYCNEKESPEIVAARAGGRRTNVVRRAEQLLAALDQEIAVLPIDATGINVEISPWQVRSVASAPSRLRCGRLVDGVDSKSLFAARPFLQSVVALDEHGQQLALCNGTKGFEYTVSRSTGEERRYSYGALAAESPVALARGEMFTALDSSGQSMSFGPITEIYTLEQMPVAFEHLRPLHRAALVAELGSDRAPVQPVMNR
jgi:hypothetical protein